MSEPTHVRCLVGQQVYYKKMPQHVCTITAVHDDMTPLLYDLAVELSIPPGTALQVHNVFPHEIKPIEDIVL